MKKFVILVVMMMVMVTSAFAECSRDSSMAVHQSIQAIDNCATQVIGEQIFYEKFESSNSKIVAKAMADCDGEWKVFQKAITSCAEENGNTQAEVRQAIKEFKELKTNTYLLAVKEHRFSQ